MRYVFGPVPSRRLGRSLGIDPVPLKTCNLSCVYCQLGRTQPMTNERREFFPAEEIVAEIAQILAERESGSIDWLTFVGTGETTLHSRTGWLIRQTKALSDLPVAVITNGSLLHRPDVRKELTAADAVLPSLDAGNEMRYRLVNRPHRQLTLKQQIAGLAEFRQQYVGALWLEVMLVRGLNDTENALRHLAEAMTRIQPDEIHINVPSRPPTEPWVEAPDRATLKHAESILGGVCESLQPAEGDFELSVDGDVVEGVMSIITRHPLTETELLKILSRQASNGALEALAELAESGMTKTVERCGTRFWCAAGARFPDDDTWAAEAVRAS
jgi:wyosine [tRNA(Phe)-imidazoG37] synthetase (radical SAM superfamily)